jgi:chorismate mutase/prephenate dehydratase
MEANNELQALRGQIDEVTDEIVDLFARRQHISAQIGAAKQRLNLAVTDSGREDAVVAAALARVDASTRLETGILIRELIALSRLRQTTMLGLTHGVELPASCELPAGAVAYQGVAGAWGEYAAGRLFAGRDLLACDYFEDVFAAVKSGEAACGVVPIENSRTGAIGEVYDLLRRNSCYIVGQEWIEVPQCLLGVPGATLRDIREVFSHQEALGQCSRFLGKHDWDLSAVRNTAVAAQMVAEKGEKRNAVIASRHAGATWGLDVLAANVADDANNRTRFIAIAAAPRYSDESTGVSVTFATRHISGALAAVLQPLGLCDINLTRIESRPASQNSYRFFADIEARWGDAELHEALNQAAQQAEYFEILGVY